MIELMTQRFMITRIDRELVPEKYALDAVNYIKWFVKLSINNGNICKTDKVTTAAYSNGNGDVYYGATVNVSHWSTNPEAVALRKKLYEQNELTTIPYYPGQYWKIELDVENVLRVTQEANDICIKLLRSSQTNIS